MTMRYKKTISDLVYSQKYELRRIRGIGKRCIEAWEDEPVEVFLNMED